jgi:Septum formation
MAAPAGVNEGIPQDPVTAGGAGVEVAPAEVVPAEVVPAPAEPVGEGLVAAPGEKPAEAAPAEVNLAEAASAKTEPAADDLGEPEPEPADGEHAEAGADGQHSEAGADGPDWDADDESRNVNPLAVIGMIVGVIALVAVAVGVLAVVTHGFRPKTVITYRPAAAFGLRPGECVNSGSNALNVTVVSCATPHDAEVFATFRLPGTGWPGDSAVQQDAGNGCESRLGGYLNPQLATADLTQEYVYPNEAAWKAGEHTVVCEVRAVSGPLTGSVRAQS